MSITATQNNAIENPGVATGRWKSSSATPGNPSLSLGFTPRAVIVYNETTVQRDEWVNGMDDASSIRHVASGALAKVTVSGITVSATGVQLPAPAQNDQLTWIAMR